MLKRIVMQVSGQLMALFTQVLGLLMGLLWKVAKHLRVSCTLLFLNVASHLALIAQKLKRSPADKTKLDMSPRLEPSNVQHQPILHGSQHTKVAAQLQQPAFQAQKQIQRHAERTKSGKFAPKGTGVAPRHIQNQPAADGTKHKERANQRRQRAISQRKKGK